MDTDTPHNDMEADGNGAQSAPQLRLEDVMEAVKSLSTQMASSNAHLTARFDKIHLDMQQTEARHKRELEARDTQHKQQLRALDTQHKQQLQALDDRQRAFATALVGHLSSHLPPGVADSLKHDITTIYGASPTPSSTHGATTPTSVSAPATPLTYASALSAPSTCAPQTPTCTWQQQQHPPCQQPLAEMVTRKLRTTSAVVWVKKGTERTPDSLLNMLSNVPDFVEVAALYALPDKFITSVEYLTDGRNHVNELWRVKFSSKPARDLVLSMAGVIKRGKSKGTGADLEFRADLTPGQSAARRAYDAIIARLRQHRVSVMWEDDEHPILCYRGTYIKCTGLSHATSVLAEVTGEHAYDDPPPGPPANQPTEPSDVDGRDPKKGRTEGSTKEGTPMEEEGATGE